MGNQPRLEITVGRFALDQGVAQQRHAVAILEIEAQRPFWAFGAKGNTKPARKKKQRGRGF
jgi:hypothetical protein